MSMCECVCVYVCVSVRDRERKRERHRQLKAKVHSESMPSYNCQKEIDSLKNSRNQSRIWMKPSRGNVFYLFFACLNAPRNNLDGKRRYINKD